MPRALSSVSSYSRSGSESATMPPPTWNATQPPLDRERADRDVRVHRAVERRASRSRRSRRRARVGSSSAMISIARIFGAPGDRAAGEGRPQQVDRVRGRAAARPTPSRPGAARWRSSRAAHSSGTCDACRRGRRATRSLRSRSTIITFSARSFSLSHSSSPPSAASSAGVGPRGRVPLIGRVSTGSPRQAQEPLGRGAQRPPPAEVEVGRERRRVAPPQPAVEREGVARRQVGREALGDVGLEDVPGQGRTRGCAPPPAGIPPGRMSRRSRACRRAHGSRAPQPRPGDRAAAPDRQVLRRAGPRGRRARAAGPRDPRGDDPADGPGLRLDPHGRLGRRAHRPGPRGRPAGGAPDRPRTHAPGRGGPGHPRRGPGRCGVARAGRGRRCRRGGGGFDDAVALAERCSAAVEDTTTGRVDVDVERSAGRVSAAGRTSTGGASGAHAGTQNVTSPMGRNKDRIRRRAFIML